MKCFSRWAAIGALLLAAACDGRQAPRFHADGSVTLFDGRVVPPLPRLLGVREQFEVRLSWLARKHAALLPLMRKHGIAMWIITNHEFHSDPVTQYIAPDLEYTGQTDVHVLVDAGTDGLKRFSSWRRPTADYARFFEPLPVPRDDRGNQDARTGLRLLFDRFNPRTVGLNYQGRRGQDGGLTYDAYQYLVAALGPRAAGRLVPAGGLIEDYFDTRLPEELEHYRALVLATDVIAQRALSNEVITPGVTRAVDVKWFFNQQIAALGVGGKPWFEIHTAVQRFDPATGKAIPYVHPAPDSLVFQRGDVIHLDCGFDYLGFASDWQKVAYVLREGERDVSEGMKLALRNANVVHQAFHTEPRPGMTGREATQAIMKKLRGVSFLPSLYSHPIGYQGHALGASINARNMVLGPPSGRDSRLRPGSYRSVEFSATTALPEWNGDSLLIPMEDDAYLTETGYEYFRPYQTSWYLIK
ncbi:MAG: M24 family metallopeptidase [Gemmatimonadetes bacterium]|nr:M24 family metallopeptidase [Gemmatimonadota bacterium]